MLAASAETSGGVMVVPALAGLGAPHWDSAARGAILGVTRATTPAEIARAALESVAFRVREICGGDGVRRVRRYRLCGLTAGCLPAMC